MLSTFNFCKLPITKILTYSNYIQNIKAVEHNKIQRLRSTTFSFFCFWEVSLSFRLASVISLALNPALLGLLALPVLGDMGGLFHGETARRRLPSSSTRLFMSRVRSSICLITSSSVLFVVSSIVGRVKANGVLVGAGALVADAASLSLFNVGSLGAGFLAADAASLFGVGSLGAGALVADAASLFDVGSSGQVLWRPM